MDDMNPEDIVGEGHLSQITYFDGTSRNVITTNVETPFPSGELIVSQTDLTGVITRFNAAFVNMSGFSEDELMGRPHSILRHPDMPAAAFQDLWQTVNDGKKWHGYVKNLRKDGGFYWVNATVIATRRAGATVGYTSVRREPSQRRIAEAKTLYATMNAS